MQNGNQVKVKCKYFHGPYGCDKGSKCKNLHEAIEENPSTPRSALYTPRGTKRKRVKVCRDDPIVYPADDRYDRSAITSCELPSCDRCAGVVVVDLIYYCELCEAGDSSFQLCRACHSIAAREHDQAHMPTVTWRSRTTEPDECECFYCLGKFQNLAESHGSPEEVAVYRHFGRGKKQKWDSTCAL